MIWPTAGFAQRTKFDGLRQCERAAAVQFRRHDPAFKRFMIDRASVFEDKFADKIGAQFISTIFHGKASYEAAGGPKPVRFICLHPGYGQEPVFVYTLPE
jgi:hypothetical protein